MSFALIDATALKMIMLPVYIENACCCAVHLKKIGKKFMGRKFESVILFDVIILWLLIVKLKLFKFSTGTCERCASCMCVVRLEKKSWHFTLVYRTDPLLIVHSIFWIFFLLLFFASMRHTHAIFHCNSIGLQCSLKC